MCCLKETFMQIRHFKALLINCENMQYTIDINLFLNFKASNDVLFQSCKIQSLVFLRRTMAPLQQCVTEYEYGCVSFRPTHSSS